MVLPATAPSFHKDRRCHAAPHAWLRAAVCGGSGLRGVAAADGREQRVDELLGTEGLQVVDLFANADEAQRLGALAGDGGHHAALGGAVELGEHEAGDADGGVEGLARTNLRSKIS